MNPWIILGTLGTTVALTLGAYFYGLDTGKDKEKLKWEEANVQVLIEGNESLAEYVEKVQQELEDARELDIKAGEKVEVKETRIIERIKEVPVEKVIKIYDDCRIDYGIVRLRNGWAQGDGVSQASEGSSTSVLPDDKP